MLNSLTVERESSAVSSEEKILYGTAEFRPDFPTKTV